jgi:hypothetical protein
MILKTEKSLSKLREENLQAMRSPGSLLLAGGTLLAVLVAFVFYDHSITDSPVLLTYLHGAFSGTVQ